MSELDELLQDRLEQLESGAPLITCLADLPEDETEFLELVISLSKVSFPEPDDDIVVVQRANLQAQASQQARVSDQARRATESPSLAMLLSRLRPRAALIGAGAAVAVLMTCALVALVVVGIANRHGRDAVLTEILTPEPTAKGEIAHGPLPTAEGEIVHSPIPAATPAPRHEAFLPMMASPEVRNPHSATLKTLRGLVEVQQDDGTWLAVNATQTITAGQRVRTAGLSRARLAFFDGSEVHLGPNTEISVDGLDAHLSEGPRVVVLTQWAGETQHQVASVSAADSRYEVRTPSGSGVARGTAFHVRVTPDLYTRFSVDEGSVAVTSLNVTVLVVAGQSTTVDADRPPGEPVFRISGEGEVTQTGPVWVIGGQTFETHNSTVIVGNPQVGSWVSVQGRVLPDGTKLADRIVLLRRAPSDRFAITGRVDNMGDAAWTVAGQAIAVNEETVLSGGIKIGDLVRVEGVILQEGTLLAEHIRLIDTPRGLPFKFIGVVQAIDPESWIISDVTVTVDDGTALAAGLTTGDIVQVSGWILDDGTWLATAISRVEDEEREFELAGKVDGIDPWIVAGIPFETRDWTDIEAEIEIGDRVRVTGRILDDGTWVATTIERVDGDDGDDDDDDDDAVHVRFVGRVMSKTPWIVSGVALIVSEETEIKGQISVGDLVKVKAEILPNGSWLARKIQRLDTSVGVGCWTVSAAVVGVSPGQIDLLNWPTIHHDDVGSREIERGSIILIFICVDADGRVTVVNIVVIHHPGPVFVSPQPPPPQPPRRDRDDDDHHDDDHHDDDHHDDDDHDDDD